MASGLLRSSGRDALNLSHWIGDLPNSRADRRHGQRPPIPPLPRTHQARAPVTLKLVTVLIIAPGEAVKKSTVIPPSEMSAGMRSDDQ